MANRNSSGFIHAIHTLFEVGTLGGQSDGQLLEQFAARKSEAAFAALVARHGPMVLSVCESLLGDAHDAEDAFQAAFLILAKKARSIRDPDLLGNWLYGVARRTAQKAKARRAPGGCVRKGRRPCARSQSPMVSLRSNRCAAKRPRCCTRRWIGYPKASVLRSCSAISKA